MGAVRILVDGDACPVKDEIYRVAYRTEIPVTIVANSHFRVRSASSQASNTRSGVAVNRRVTVRAVRECSSMTIVFASADPLLNHMV